MIKQFFLLLIKYIPIIQMVGVLVNNTLYCFDVITKTYHLLNYLTGNSLITTILLYVCSYVFKFCSWYRLIVTANIINITIALLYIYIKPPITDFQLLVSYYTVCVLFLLIIIINKFKCSKKTSD